MSWLNSNDEKLCSAWLKNPLLFPQGTISLYAFYLKWSAEFPGTFERVALSHLKMSTIQWQMKLSVASWNIYIYTHIGRSGKNMQWLNSLLFLYITKFISRNCVCLQSKKLSSYKRIKGEKKKSKFNSITQQAYFPDTTYISQYFIIFWDITKGKVRMIHLWSTKFATTCRSLLTAVNKVR